MLESPKEFLGLLIQLEEESQSNPGDLGLLQRLGRLYLRNGSVDEAIKTFNKILVFDSDNVTALIELGLCLIKSRQFDGAQFVLERAQELKPRLHTVFLALAKLFAAKGNVEQQVAFLMRAANANQEKIEVRLSLAELLKKYGDIAGAISQFELVLEKSPKLEAALFSLGIIYLKKNEITKAVPYFLNVIQNNPGAFDAHFNLGTCFFRQQKFSKAIFHLGIASRSSKMKEKAIYLAAQCYFKMRDFDRAIVAMEKLVAIDENSISYLKCLGEFYQEANEFDLARDIHRTLSRRYPERPEFMVRLTTNLVEMNELEQAEKALDELFRNHPGHIEGHKILGEIYLKKFEFKAAIEEFRRTLMINEKYVPAMLGMANAFNECGEIRKEYDMLKEAVENGAQSVSVLLRLGELERTLEVPTSIDRFKRVKELAPESEYAREADYYLRHQAA